MSITQERLKEVLRYDPETGRFVRLKNRYRKDLIGRDAGAFNKALNCFYIAVDGKRLRSHRVAWFYMTGSWPKHEIDHIDGNPANNVFSNLREADSSQNKANRRINSNNSTGFKGVVPDGGKFKAFIQFRGKKRYLGSYDTPQAAHLAYKTTEKLVFGEFARGDR